MPLSLPSWFLVLVLSTFGALVSSQLLEAWSILHPPHRVRPPHPPRPPRPQKLNYTTYNVMDFGAKGDGVSDDTQAFQAAWSAACQGSLSTLFVPHNQTFVVYPTNFSGPCGDGMTFELSGTLSAPGFDDWPMNGSEVHKSWLQFKNLHNFTLKGSGTFHGQGETWWPHSCKLNHSEHCYHSAPEAVVIQKSSNVTVQDLNFLNSQQMHLIFDSCSVVHVTGLTVTAPQKSPNTDGIHLHAVEDASIENCVIGTGDDCISIQTGSSRVKIKNVICGPGHGISIGSLGKNGGKASVKAIVVDGALINGTSNGLRIKTWQGGRGNVYGVLYENVRMVGVANPIIIDQYYCDSAERPCKNQTSAVEVSGIIYRNITGTSSTPVAVKFACSDSVPCHGIVLTQVDLSSASKSKSPDVKSFCENASGIVLGDVTPVGCLATTNKS